MKRGEIWWADLGTPIGSEPGYRRPVIIIQSDDYNASRLHTVIVAVLTGNTALAAMPGNRFLPQSATGLEKDSVVNVTAITAVDRAVLDDQPVGEVPDWLMADVDAGLRRVLDLLTRPTQAWVAPL